MSQPTLQELEKHTCKSYGGNNCILHQCMFGCVLEKAKQKLLNEEKKKVNSKTY